MEDLLKLIAFYLPQYHPIPENDAWWGKGFTEWMNVTKAYPNFTGHYQPHLPADLGYYDLRVPEVREAQAELAKKYGIYGFCYHHYWFGGKRLLERPFNEVLRSGKPDFPFCLCWANENWTRRWDGAEENVLIAQQHSPEDDLAFIRDIIPAFQDPRYIRINGKPLLIIYRVNLLPTPLQTVEIWQKEAYRNGIKGLYLVAAQSFGISNPLPFGFDAAVEFPPHNARGMWINFTLDITNKDYSGNIFDYSKVAANHILQDIPVETTYPLFHTVMPSWDNAARRQNKCHTFYNSSPESYYIWLKSVIDHTRNKHNKDEQIVFINAWNEWAEGCHLEPDMRYGHSYLEATRKALEDRSESNVTILTEKLHYINETSNLKLLARIELPLPPNENLEKIIKVHNGIILSFPLNNFRNAFSFVLNCEKNFCVEFDLEEITADVRSRENEILEILFAFVSQRNYLHIYNKPALFIKNSGITKNAENKIEWLRKAFKKQSTDIFIVCSVENELTSGLLIKTSSESEHGSGKSNQDYQINHAIYPSLDAMAEIQPGNCMSVMSRMGYDLNNDSKILDTIPNLPVRHDFFYKGIYTNSTSDISAYSASIARQITESIKSHNEFLINNICGISDKTNEYLAALSELKKMSQNELEYLFKKYYEENKTENFENNENITNIPITEEKLIAYYPEGKKTYNKIGIAIRKVYSWGDRNNYKVVTGLFTVTGKLLYLCGLKKAGKDFLNIKKYI